MVLKREQQVLFAACEQAGCPFCRLVQESVRRYLESWKYALFTDVGVRTALRQSQGFCHAHTWQLAHMGATLPLAQAYRDIVSDSIEQLQRANSATGSGGLWQRLFETKQDRPVCPACQRQQQVEANYAHTLRQAILDEAFYTQFAASEGLCLDHFRLTCELKATDTPGAWFPLLRNAQLVCLQRLDQQLGELIRKHDYRFKDEARGPEMLSWKRAASVVAGEENH